MKPCKNCGEPFYVQACHDIGGTLPQKKYCGRQCYVNGHYHKTADELLWERIDKNHPSGCWVYQGAADRRGYGRPAKLLEDGRRQRYYAHRRSYEIHKGPIPKGKLVLHTCHNPPCCNPDHLYLGNDQDNANDRVAAGRGTFGERNSHAKVTAAQVQEIRAAYWYRNGRSNIHELAAKYGISHITAGAIVSGRTWRHLPHTPIKPRSICGAARHEGEK
jgi:hypothetical protein